jgi:hypothetical protein
MATKAAIRSQEYHSLILELSPDMNEAELEAFVQQTLTGIEEKLRDIVQTLHNLNNRLEKSTTLESMRRTVKRN